MSFKKFWNLATDASNPESLNMYVYGEICASSSFFGGEDDVVASHFVEDLNKYNGVKNINVYINSPGGSVFAAASIINQLKNHPATVHTWCDGICASAAVGILMAADPGCRHMSRSTLLMIHNPSTQARGDQSVFLKTADLLAKVKNTLVSIYQVGTGLSAEQLSAMMDAETYLDADEALKYNFIDSITEDSASYSFQNEGTFICNGITMDVAALENVQHLKEHLQKLSEASAAITLEEGGFSEMTVENKVDATQEEVVNTTPEDVSDVNDSVKDLQDSLKKAEEEKEALTAQVADLQAQIVALQAPKLTAEEEMLANVSDDVKALLAQARADALEAQKALTAMKEQQEFNAFKETFSAFKFLPIRDEHVKAMQALMKNDENMYNDLLEILRVADTAMGTGFVSMGTDQGTDVAGGEAIDVLEQRISAYQAEHAGATYNAAMQAVLREDPTLYEEYRRSFSKE